MNKIICYPVSLLSSILLSLTNIHAQDNLKFPVPAGDPNQLFYLQRSQNINTVIYELNKKDGELDTVAPVHIYWICYAEKGQTEELTGIQRKYAYGLATKFVSKDHYELRFLANKKKVFELKIGTDHQLHVFTQINGKQAILSKMYLQIHGGTPLSPHIEYVLFDGIDSDSGEAVSEKKTVRQ